MLRVLVAVAVAVAPVGCGGGGPCKERSGSYRYKLQPQSGSCAAYETVVVLGGASPATAGCTDRGSSMSEDACDVTVDISCADSASAIAMRGKMEWNADGSYGSGTMSMTLSDSYGVICDGVMSVTYERL